MLDEFLDGTRFIPTIFQRTSFLMREVDAKQSRDLFLLKKAQEAHLEAVVKRSKLEKPTEADEALAERVQQIRARLDIRAQEKRVLSQQLVDLCKTNVDKLNANCAYLESELKRLGELEDEDQHLFLPSASFTSSQTPALPVPPPQPLSVSPLPPSSSSQQQSPPPSTAAAAAVTAPPVVQHTAPPQNMPPGQLVAANSEELWILAKFVEDKQENILVADADNDASRLLVPRNKVVFLQDREELNFAKQRLPKGRTVFALYPETTSFYPALIAQAPFVQAGKVNVYCVFADDEDEVTNVAPKRMVPVQFVFAL